VTSSVLEPEDLGVETMIEATGELVDASSALRDAPLMLDLTDGSTVFGDVLLPPRHPPGRLPQRMLLSDPWEGIDLRQELGAEGSVQARTAEIATGEAMWVATDHRSGELADFISLSVAGIATSTAMMVQARGVGLTTNSSTSDLCSAM
jgi:hypothetical protein